MVNLPDPFPFKVSFDFSSHVGSSKNQTKGFKTARDREKWLVANRNNLKNVKKI